MLLSSPCLAEHEFRPLFFMRWKKENHGTGLHDVWGVDRARYHLWKCLKKFWMYLSLFFLPAINDCRFEWRLTIVIVDLFICHAHYSTSIIDSLIYLNSHIKEPLRWQIQRYFQYYSAGRHEKLSILLPVRDHSNCGRTNGFGVHARRILFTWYFKRNSAGFYAPYKFYAADDLRCGPLYREEDFQCTIEALSRIVGTDFLRKKIRSYLTDLLLPLRWIISEKIEWGSEDHQVQTDFAAFSKKRTQVKTTFWHILHAHWEWTMK